MQNAVTALCSALSLVALAQPVLGYGPLQHVRVVQATSGEILGTLRAGYPNKTLDDKRLVAMAAIGAMVYDLGYLPLPPEVQNPLRDFSNLAHYQATGRLVETLLSQAMGPAGSEDAAAFSLGVLSHYSADRMGHYWATNRVSALLLRDSGLPLGSRLSYADNPGCHYCIEKSFDLVALREIDSAVREDLGEIINEALLSALDRSKVLAQCLRVLQESVSLTYGVPSSLFPTNVVLQGVWRMLLRVDAAMEASERTYGINASRVVSRSVFRRAFEREYGPAREDAKCGAITESIEKSGKVVKDWFTESFDRSKELSDRHLRGLERTLPPARLSPWRAGIAPPDVNLDTNMPAAQGTYALADESFSFLTANSPDARDSRLPFVRAYRFLGTRKLDYICTSLPNDSLMLGDRAWDLYWTDVDLNRTVSPGRRMSWPLPDRLPRLLSATGTECASNSLRSLNLGLGVTVKYNQDTVCVSPDHTALEVMLAVVASGQSGAGARRGASTKTEEDLRDYYVDTRYALGEFPREVMQQAIRKCGDLTIGKARR